MKKITLLFIFIFLLSINAKIQGQQKDSCSFIEYGTQNVKFDTSRDSIFHLYGEVDETSGYGHSTGFVYYDEDKNIFLIFGEHDFSLVEVIIAKEFMIDEDKSNIIKLDNKDITTQKGVKLGMKQREVVDIIGKPKYISNSCLIYETEGINCPVEPWGFDIGYEACYTFIKDKLVMIDLLISD